LDVAVDLQLGLAAAEPEQVALGGAATLGGGGDCAAQLALVLAERLECRAELAGAVRDGQLPLELLEAADDERLVEPLGELGGTPQDLRRGVTHPETRRDPRERGLRLARALLRGVSLAGGTLGALGELLRIGSELAAPRVELEQHGLRGLTRKPELAAIRVVAEALARHGRDRRGEQLVLRLDGELGDEFARVAPDEPAQRAESRRRGTLDERKRLLQIAGDDRGRTRAERGGDRALLAGGHVEQRERESCAELARRRRQTVALGERPLDRREPLLRRPDLLRERVALMDGLACRSARVERGALELLGRGTAVGFFLLRKLGAELCRERDRGLAARRQPAGLVPQPVERAERALTLAGRIGQLLLDGGPPGEQRLEPVVRVGVERPLAREQPLRRLPRPLGPRFALDGGDLRGRGRFECSALELRDLDRRRVGLGSRGGELLLEPRPQPSRGLGAQLNPVSRSAEAVERLHRRFALPRCVGE